MFTRQRRAATRTSRPTPACCCSRRCRRCRRATPLEEVVLIRDEMANMVWGVERTIPLPTRRAPSRGAEAGARDARVPRRACSAATPARRRAGRAARATIRYQVMTSVPEHWIPFVPVHVARRRPRRSSSSGRRCRGSSRATRPAGRQGRAAHRRSCARASTAAARRRTSCTRRRSRARARGSPRRYQRTRWRDGRVGRLARRAQADRPRRGLERARVRPARGRAAGGVTGLSRAATTRPRRRGRRPGAARDSGSAAPCRSRSWGRCAGWRAPRGRP